MEIGALVTVRNNVLKLNTLKLIQLNLPKFNISNFRISLKSFDLFYPTDLKTGANININISSKNPKSKLFYLSSLLFYDSL